MTESVEEKPGPTARRSIFWRIGVYVVFIHFGLFLGTAICAWALNNGDLDSHLRSEEIIVSPLLDFPVWVYRHIHWFFIAVASANGLAVIGFWMFDSGRCGSRAIAAYVIIRVALVTFVVSASVAALNPATSDSALLRNLAGAVCGLLIYALPLPILALRGIWLLGKRARGGAGRTERMNGIDATKSPKGDC